MVGDVAMEHPVAGVISDEGDFNGLARRHQHRIPPLPTRVGFAVAADDTEAVAVQMHRVPPRSLVAQRQYAGLAPFERNERRHTRLAIASHRHAVHGPGRATYARHPHPAHHPTLQRDLMALGSGKIGLGQWVDW